MRAFVLLFVTILTCPVSARADDVNIATWYPTGPNTGRVHGDRVSVGSPYNPTPVPDALIPDGTLIVRNNINIGTAIGPVGAVPNNQLRLDVTGAIHSSGGGTDSWPLSTSSTTASFSSSFHARRCAISSSVLTGPILSYSKVQFKRGAFQYQLNMNYQGGPGGGLLF